MKKKLYLLIWLHALTYLSFGKEALQKDTINIKTISIINLNNRAPIITFNNFTNSSSWESMHAFTGPPYIEMLKSLKANVILIVKIKRNVKVLSLTDIFNLYHIAEKYRHSKVMYDDDLLDHPETTIATATQITNVKVIKYNNRYFIDIIGTDYNDVKEAREAKKRGEKFVN